MKTLYIIIIIITYSSVEANPDRSSWLVPPNATYRNEYSDCTRCATCNNCSFLLSRSSWMITPSGWNETVTILTRPPFNLPSVHFYPYLCILLSTSCPWQYLYHHPLTQKITWTSTNESMQLWQVIVMLSQSTQIIYPRQRAKFVSYVHVYLILKKTWTFSVNRLRFHAQTFPKWQKVVFQNTLQFLASHFGSLITPCQGNVLSWWIQKRRHHRFKQTLLMLFKFLTSETKESFVTRTNYWLLPGT